MCKNVPLYNNILMYRYINGYQIFFGQFELTKQNFINKDKNFVVAANPWNQWNVSSSKYWSYTILEDDVSTHNCEFCCGSVYIHGYYASPILFDRSLLVPYAWKFQQYVNFMDFAVAYTYSENLIWKFATLQQLEIVTVYSTCVTFPQNDNVYT